MLPHVLVDIPILSDFVLRSGLSHIKATFRFKQKYGVKRQPYPSETACMVMNDYYGAKNNTNNAHGVAEATEMVARLEMVLKDRLAWSQIDPNEDDWVPAYDP